MSDTGDLQQSTFNSLFDSPTISRIFRQFFRGFATGRVGHNVDPDPGRSQDPLSQVGVTIGGFMFHPFLPQTAQIIGAVDDGRAAAKVDTPEIDSGGIQQILTAEYRMVALQFLQRC